MKKKVAILTLCLFMIGIFAGPVMAKNTASDWIPPGQLKKIVDIDQDWAQDYIEQGILKGYIKGYGDGTYQPNKPVTCLETIIMLVRAAGLEDEVEDYNLSEEEELLLFKIPDWAKAYVAVALNEGILSEDEIKTFNPNQAAKRYQICVYMNNILNEFEDDLDEDDLEFMEGFMDDDLIPAKARHSVRLMARLGVVNGYPDGSFGPNRAVKRNEMAAMLYHLDDIYCWHNGGKDIDSEIEILVGTLDYIDYDEEDESLILEAEDEDFELEIYETDDVDIYFDDDKMAFDEDLEEDIETGGIIIALLEDDELEWVRIYSDEDYDVQLGTLVDIDYYEDDEDMLSLEAEDEDFELEIYETDDVDIYFDDDKMAFDEDLEEDIDTGGIIVVLLDDDDDPLWVRIYAPCEESSEEDIDSETEILVGTLDYIDYDEEDESLILEAEDEDFELEIYESDDVEIYYDDEEMAFDEDLEEDIETGGIIIALLEDDELEWVRIYSDEDYDVLLGTLADIDYYEDDEDMLRLKAEDEDFKLWIYETDDVDIYFDDDKMAFDEDLEEDIDTDGIIVVLLDDEDDPLWVRIYAPYED